MTIIREATLGGGPVPQRRRSRRPAISTAAGFLCVLAPASFWFLWFYSFSHQNTQADRLHMFRSFFPAFLNDGLTLPYLSIGLCISGIALASFYWTEKGSVLRSISIMTITAGAIMLLLTVFSML